MAREPIHPGEILLEEFLKPMGITPYRLAKETMLSQTRISEIVKCKRSVTPETAIRFSKFFGNSPEFWLGIQSDYDLEKAKKQFRKEISLISCHSCK